MRLGVSAGCGGGKSIAPTGGAASFYDPLLAANHFAGQMQWIPLNRAMSSGSCESDPAELARYADAAAESILRGDGTPTAK